MMNGFLWKETNLSGLMLCLPPAAEDRRGCFFKTFEQSIFLEHGIFLNPFEIFYTRSTKTVLRGLHFQRRHCQDKLVQVLSGAVYDVAVDLREGSATFGQWQGFELSAENRQMLYIPKGFAHGFLALTDDVLFSYLCGDRYDPESDGGIRYDDPQLAVRWPLAQGEAPIVSDKDAALPSLAEFLSTYGPLPGDSDNDENNNDNNNSDSKNKAGRTGNGDDCVNSAGTEDGRAPEASPSSECGSTLKGIRP